MEHPIDATNALFPDTKYMGSKKRVLDFILEKLAPLPFNSVLDAFSGSGCVSYALKQKDKQVFSNDLLKFCSDITKATVENNDVRLSDADLTRLINPNKKAETFIRDTYRNLFFDESDSEFLDHLRANIRTFRNPHKKALALAAASRACMKKRPRGLFTFTGRKGWDGRKDLKLTLREQFMTAALGFNCAVFHNGKENQSFNSDVFDLDVPKADLAYIDTPYISPFSDCDYTRRYHFVEAFSRDWQGVELMEKTKTKKIRSFKTAFASKTNAVASFERLFKHLNTPILAVSYSSNCIPNKEEMVQLLKAVRRSVKVYATDLRYSHGNHQHKVESNNNKVEEYLFIAR